MSKRPLPDIKALQADHAQKLAVYKALPPETDRKERYAAYSAAYDASMRLSKAIARKENAE